MPKKLSDTAASARLDAYDEVVFHLELLLTHDYNRPEDTEQIKFVIRQIETLAARFQQRHYTPKR